MPDDGRSQFGANSLGVSLCGRLQQVAVRGNHRGTQPHAPAALIFDKVPVLNAQTLLAEIGRRQIEKDAACPALQHLQFMLIGASFPQSSYSCKKVPTTRN